MTSSRAPTEVACRSRVFPADIEDGGHAGSAADPACLSHHFESASAPVRVGLPHLNLWGRPVRALINAEDADSPEDATCIQRTRDRWLALMLEPHAQGLLLWLALIWAVAFFFFLAAVIVLIFPVVLHVPMGALTTVSVDACNVSQYNSSHVLSFGSLDHAPQVTREGLPPGAPSYTFGVKGGYVAEYCTPAQQLMNYCVKFFPFWNAYINTLPILWTISIVANAVSSNAVSPTDGKLGVDFYGRDSESLWFHLPRKDRSRIAALLLLALCVQPPDAAFNMYYPSYMAAATWPAQFLTRFWLVFQVVCQVSASLIQMRAERKVRLKHPDRFPPAVGTYLTGAHRRWREQNAGAHVRFACCNLWCGERSFSHFVWSEMKGRKGDSGGGVSGGSILRDNKYISRKSRSRKAASAAAAAVARSPGGRADAPVEARRASEGHAPLKARRASDPLRPSSRSDPEGNASPELLRDNPYASPRRPLRRPSEVVDLTIARGVDAVDLLSISSNRPGDVQRLPFDALLRTSTTGSHQPGGALGRELGLSTDSVADARVSPAWSHIGLDMLLRALAQRCQTPTVEEIDTGKSYHQPVYSPRSYVFNSWLMCMCFIAEIVWG